MSANLHSGAAQFRVDPIAQTSGDASTCGFARRLRYPGKRNIGAFGNVYRPASKGRMMGKVLHFRALGASGLRQLGPVFGPIHRPQLAATDARQFLDGSAAVGRNSFAGTPVGDGLNGLTKCVCKSLQPTRQLDGLVQGRKFHHGAMVNDTCTLGQHVVSPYRETSGMEDLVWPRVDEELRRRGGKNLAPGSWPALTKALGTTKQVVYNWKQRGIPAKEYPAIAEALGWTVDELLGNGEARPPESELKQDHSRLFDMLPEAEQKKAHAYALGLFLKKHPDLAESAAKWAQSGGERGQHLGGVDTNYGDLSEGDAGKASGGAR